MCVYVCVCVRERVCVCMCVSMCVCVCERERESTEDFFQIFYIVCALCSCFLSFRHFFPRINLKFIIMSALSMQILHKIFAKVHLQMLSLFLIANILARVRKYTDIESSGFSSSIRICQCPREGSQEKKQKNCCNTS